MPSLDNYTPYKATCPHTCTTYRNIVQEQRTGTTYRNRCPTGAAATREERARAQTLVEVGLATFMTYLDNNVTNVAIPTIQRSLHLSIAGLEWVVSSYILVFAGLMLAGGRLAGVHRRRRVFPHRLVGV